MLETNHHEDRLQEIETKISFQEQFLEALNEALTGQQKQLDDLQRTLARISNQLAAPDAEIKKTEEEVPPPHY